jgi:hypothetical protein
MELVALREGYQPRFVAQSKTGGELAEELFAEAEERGQPFLYHSPESWRKKWLTSRTFRLMKIPLNSVALPCEPKGRNLVLKKIHAREEKPILVEYNKNRIGSSRYGYVPEVVVIDGKHRYEAAVLRGDTHILAFVGELAAEVMAVGGGAVGGGGGGPAPERTTPAPGASLVAKKKKVKAGGSEQVTRLQDRGNATYSAKGKHLSQLDVKRIYGQFRAACKIGKYKPKLEAVAPPGWEDSVKQMKDNDDIDNPYALAWWMHDKGYAPGGKGK